MLIGHYIHGLDDKKRISIPAKWRTVLGKKVVVTSGLDKSLFVYSLKEWQKIAEKLSSLSFASKDTRSFTRFMLSNAFETDLDSVGRILITDQLKKIADIKKKVVLVGMHSRIEIWDEEEWERYSILNNKSAESVAEKLSDIGVL
ncbi:Transcriptional regulator MraZ [bioreactor metagenome]|uniref:Transcriptional regulator MraZ n=1 Tax=bioreactor metagenome TaxID=1076179 RepID=A0A644T7H0_9ZZZZ|nr:division/cell wall cluster transcriptional repressor MraZ [Candidatus Elulimicrobiales bacterium]